MAVRREPPLDERELRLVRGMIDQYSYMLHRVHTWNSVWGFAAKAAATLAALAVLAASVKQLWPG